MSPRSRRGTPSRRRARRGAQREKCSARRRLPRGARSRATPAAEDSPTVESGDPRSSPALTRPSATMADVARLLVLGAGPAQLGVLAAARAAALTVVAADRDPSAPGFRYADRRAIVSIEDEPAIERLARAEEVDGIVAPGSDHAVATAARTASRLGLP